jgi:hypothetical protein
MHTNSDTLSALVQGVFFPRRPKDSELTRLSDVQLYHRTRLQDCARKHNRRSAHLNVPYNIQYPFFGPQRSLRYLRTGGLDLLTRATYPSYSSRISVGC